MRLATGTVTLHLRSGGFEEHHGMLRRHRLHRLFYSAFPRGRPGVGLLLLRAAVGLSAVVQGGIYLADRGDPILATWVAGALALVSGALLLVGLLTPLAGILAGLGDVSVALSWFPAPAPNLLDGTVCILFLVVMAAAIVLLGPGAFSLDARLFGRREIVIPRSSRPPKP